MIIEEKGSLTLEDTVKNENLFEILNHRNNIDFLCIKAKNAHSKYDIHKAYDICV
jgi:anaphase-promoting complex subunit 6